MNRISQSNKNIILISISLIVIGACTFFIGYPYYSKIQDINQQIYDQRVHLAILQQQRVNSEQTKQEYNKIKDETSDVQKIFIDEKSLLDLISQLEKTAVEDGVKQSINLSLSSQKISNGKLSFSITVDGTWPAIYHYISDMEKIQTYILVDTFSVTKNSSTVTCSMSATIFSST